MGEAYRFLHRVGRGTGTFPPMISKLNDGWPKGYLHSRAYCKLDGIFHAFTLSRLTHLPVSISAKDPSEYVGEHHPHWHPAILSVDKQTNTNTVPCCQPLINTRTCKRYPRERNGDYTIIMEFDL